MKKKLVIVSTFVFAMLIMFCNLEGKEIKAEQNCITHTDYYLFLDASTSEQLLNIAENNPVNEKPVLNIDGWTKYYNRFTSKDRINLGIPKNTTISDHGQIDVVVDANIDKHDMNEWSSGYFFQKFTGLGKLGDPTAIEVFSEEIIGNEINKYIFLKSWSSFDNCTTDEHGKLSCKNKSETVFDFTDVVGLSVTDFTNSVAELKYPYTIIDVPADPNPNIVNFPVGRSYSKANPRGNYGIPKNATGIVWSPAVYYFQYETCEEIQPEPDYSLTVEFLDEETNTEIKKPFKDSTRYKNGENYEYVCGEIENYELVNTDSHPNHLSGVFSDSDITKQCYYKSKPKYDLTVEHFEKDTNEKLTDDFKSGNYSEGQEYEYTCVDIPGYKVIDDETYPKFIQGKFANESIKRECYYEKDIYTLTVNYGSDENCEDLIKESDTYDLKYKEKATYKVPDKIGDLSNPTLGTFSNQFYNSPVLDGLDLSVEMPAKNVNVCIVYTPQTGLSWIYFVWVIGILSFGYSSWYFMRNYKKQND